MTSSIARGGPDVRALTVFERRAMGSPLRLITVGLNRIEAAAAWRIVSEDVERTEAALSRFRDSSGLTRLNRSGGDAWQTVDGRLYRMLATSHRAQRLTGGRFDPRVLGCLEELGEHGADLSGIDLGRGPSSTSGPWLDRIPRACRVRVRQAVDSGGIGKGLGLRWALRAVTTAGIVPTGLLLDAGGDVAVQGQAADGAWRIGVDDPRGGTEPLAVIEPADGAVATSSIAVRQWVATDGSIVHHLIDPATGQPGGGGLLAVTARAADPARAEVWSKALFLAGPGRIGPEARGRGMAVWWVEADGSLHMTPAARQLTAWTRDEGNTSP